MRNGLVRGMACLVLGALVFSFQDVVIKAIAPTYPVTEALTLRAVVAMPILLALVRLDGGIRTLASPLFVPLSVRAATQFASYTCYYLAIAAMPLADVVALFFTAPLMILLLAGPYLGERVQWVTLVSALIGLAGVLVMVRPGDGLLGWTALLALGSAALYAISQLMARKMALDVSAAVMTFYQNGFYLIGSLTVTGAIAGVGAPQSAHPSIQFLTRPWVWPSLIDFAMMGACGVIAATGMTLLTQAYRLAPANRIATFEYAGVIWAPLWAFFLFAEVPQLTTLIGAALIVGGGIVALNAGVVERFRRTPEAV